MNSLSKIIGEKLLNTKNILITAESCTAGLISATVSKTSGSSSWLEGGFVVYSPQAKTKFLNVHPDIINEFNITSEEVAYAMAYGALDNAINATVSIAVTGIAGPNGGTEDIPVGTVCIAYGRLQKDHYQILTEKCFFTGTREEIQEKVVIHALSKLNELLN